VYVRPALPSWFHQPFPHGRNFNAAFKFPDQRITATPRAKAIDAKTKNSISTEGY
jgi:hypothetical protein